MGMEKKRGVKAEERGIKSGRREGKREEHLRIICIISLYIRKLIKFNFFKYF